MALAVLHCLAFESALLGAALGPTRAARHAAAPQMVSAKEVFGQYYEASTPVQKTLEKVPPPVAKGAMGALVGVSALGGFLLTLLLFLSGVRCGAKVHDVTGQVGKFGTPV